MRSGTFSIVAALLCGCGASPSAEEDPPGSTPADLEGYWISLADQGAVTWLEGMLALGRVEDGELVDEARFAGVGLGAHTLVARSDGGFAVGLDTLPESNQAGVGAARRSRPR